MRCIIRKAKMEQPIMMEAGLPEDAEHEPEKFGAIAEKAGLVKLAADQDLPECLEGNCPRAKAFRDMLAANFRCVELAERKE